jgi:hypothetical protein
MVFTIMGCAFLGKKAKIKFLLASMKSFTNCEKTAACFGFPIAVVTLKVIPTDAFDPENYSESRP